ncbi:Hypothetical protein PP7435_CHR2-1462 [Komagataella phaffii CBS 7435]|uniref:Uncharacterized protein n=1 Tax=Komagataella phaffii (strain ATCC 76273 / CBS 7435 / CECT 11047 / NRRL Y-11430 / Wegner 21-1) TaxID=981350 RepID=A0A1G4KPN1_KOMPC|nr:Hypothetical protein BQ9382_C2-0632 [Komagataella phaffii CBS 7435]SCV11971.1 Hypothetical protein PP7435_CHR2-1462 [Komagataella phaffii CBS 7435]
MPRKVCYLIGSLRSFNNDLQPCEWAIVRFSVTENSLVTIEEDIAIIAVRRITKGLVISNLEVIDLF